MPSPDTLGPSSSLGSLILDLPLQTDVDDLSPYRHHGVLSGTASFSEGGLLGDGSTNCGAIVAHRPALILPPPWTISCAVKIDPSDVGGIHSLVSLDIAGEWAPPYCQAWFVVQGSGRVAIAAGSDLELIGVADVCDDAWHHVAAIYTGNQLQLYVDGVFDAATAHTGTYVPTIQSVFLGQHPSTEEYLVGRMAHVKVHRIALHPTKLAALAAADTPTS